MSTFHGQTSARGPLVWLVCVLLLPAAPLFAQGSISGELKDPAGTTREFLQAPLVAALVLPDDSHPFNEICAGPWQQAMTDLSEGREPETPLGGLLEGITPESHVFVRADTNGRFALTDLPFERRIALAARVGGIWWPAAREYWLTADQPQATLEIAFFTLDETLTPTLQSHRLEAVLTMRQDLKYAGISFRETIRFENTDPARAAIVELRLPVHMPPNILARQLPLMYGSQLMFMQGTDALPAQQGDASSPLAQQAWRFGSGDPMHGITPVYNKGPQRSADSWHMLNAENLHMLGAGETLYLPGDSPSGRGAELVFRRPVPPALHGTPGLLLLRVLHRDGVPMADPGTKIRLVRSFPVDLQRAEAQGYQGLTLQALVPDGHRSLYPTADGQAFASTQVPALAAGQQAEIILGLDDSARAFLNEMAGAQPATGAQPEEERRLRWNVLFLTLAVAFGVAFAAALVASLRAPREQQLEKLAALPGSRRQLVDSLAALESEYKRGKLPASAYVVERQRLITRLIEFDAADQSGK